MKHLLVFTVAALLFSSCAPKKESTKIESTTPGITATIKTTKGPIVVSLEFEKTPLTVCNFVGLAEGKIKNSAVESGTPYFNGQKFHRVVKDFMIQGGDPDGTGRGGPGYKFRNEIDSTLKHDGPGVLAMANAGPNTNGSQFYITHKATPHLDGKHTVFGHVVDGQDVVDQIQQNDEIIGIRISRNGEKAGAFSADQAMFDSLKAVQDSLYSISLSNELSEMTKRITELYPNTIKHDKGYYYEITKEGVGTVTPTADSMVTVHYRGMILGGKQFADSHTGEPADVVLTPGKVLSGWAYAITDMKKGEQRTIILPPELAYGDRAYASMIPARSWLVFELELVDF